MPFRLVSMYDRFDVVLGETGFGFWVRLGGREEPFRSLMNSGSHHATTFAKCVPFLVLSYQNVTKEGF